MKKISILIISIFLLININACIGYTPIYSSSNFNFKIENYSLKGEKKLANLIYKKLYNVTLANKDNPDSQSIILLIKTNKERKPTVKNNAGKILEYEINLNTKIIISNFLTNQEILNKDFNYSIGYKVQDEHSETIKLENKNIENLINKTVDESLIKITEVLSKK